MDFGKLNTPPPLLKLALPSNLFEINKPPSGGLIEDLQYV